MADSGKASKRVWLGEQVAAYKKMFPRFQKYADVLDEVLKRKAKEIAPLAIIQARAKDVSSFAGKAIRKRAKCPNPAMAL